MNQEIPAIEIFRSEIMNACLRYSQESDLDICQMIGALRLVEHDLIASQTFEGDEDGEG